ncbi:MAG TPA: hypothetical protein VF475_04835 [Sphingobium sp.]
MAVKLITIERLLILLLSDKRYLPLIENMRRDLYEEFGLPLNKLFPSDPEYRAISDIKDAIEGALEQIEHNIEFVTSGDSE